MATWVPLAAVALGEATQAVRTAAAERLNGQVSGRFAGSAKAFDDSLRDLPLLLAVMVLLICMILAASDAQRPLGIAVVGGHSAQMTSR